MRLLLLPVLACILPAAAGGQDPLARAGELKGVPLDDGRALIHRSLFAKEDLPFLRGLRRAPLAPPPSTPDPLLADKHLGRKSAGVETEWCRLESDWLGAGELRNAASLAERVRAVLGEVFGKAGEVKVHEVSLAGREDYGRLIDKLTDDEPTRKRARRLSSLCVGSVRCGYESEEVRFAALVIADGVYAWAPPAVGHQTALVEGLHTYLAALVTGDRARFVDPTATTPDRTRGDPVAALFAAAREHFRKGERQSLRTILGMELNSLTFERIAVAFAFVDLLFREFRDRLPAFAEALARGTFDKEGNPKSIDARREALAAAAKEGLKSGFEELEKRLERFVLDNYALPDDVLVDLIDFEKVISKARIRTFKKVVAKKREGKRTNSNEERIYREVREKLEEVLQGREIGF